MKTELLQQARAAGFDACRIAAAGQGPHSAFFEQWLGREFHASMAWLAKDPWRRCDPRFALPGAKSVVMLAANYFQGEESRPAVPAADLAAVGRVARYARGADYHNVLKKRVQSVERWLEERGGEQRSYTDTGPVLERDFAALAGIGWQGKSTMLLNETLGTWFFLSAILTTLDFEPDAPVTHRCGKCTRCIAACPTGAIEEPYVLNAAKCLSYLTIENRGPIPEAFREAMGDRIFGCDDCLDACPWNRFALSARHTAFSVRPGIGDVPLRTLLDLDDESLALLVRGTPLARAGRDGFRRNVCVALGNTGAADDVPALKRAVERGPALVAEHAQWAIARITSRIEPRAQGNDCRSSRMADVFPSTLRYDEAAM